MGLCHVVVDVGVVCIVWAVVGDIAFGGEAGEGFGGSVFVNRHIDALTGDVYNLAFAELAVVVDVGNDKVTFAVAVDVYHHSDFAVNVEHCNVGESAVVAFYGLVAEYLDAFGEFGIFGFDRSLGFCSLCGLWCGKSRRIEKNEN